MYAYLVYFTFLPNNFHMGNFLLKHERLCTLTYFPENFMQKVDLDQKLLAIDVSCLFERNRRLFFNLTGDSATERF